MEWHGASAWLGGLLMPTAVVLGIAVALWSNRAQARKLVRKWGIADPTHDQIDEVLRYRRFRLAYYPLLFVTFGILFGLFGPLGQEQDSSDHAPLLLPMFGCGAVLAELHALHRARRRGLRPVRLLLADVLSRWGVGLHAALVLLTFVLGLVDLQAQPHITPSVLRLARADGDDGHLGFPIAVPFAGTAVVLLLVALVLWSALTRSFSADAEVDRALRIRTARVALGLGIALQLSLLPLASWRMGFVADYGTGADLIPTGPETFGLDPAAVAVRDWASQINEPVELVIFLSSIVVLLSWIYVANPPSSVRRRVPR